jgi:5-formyltetrahydrofolate cyclo-ligase
VNGPVKKELRDIMRQRRQALTADEVRAASERCCAHAAPLVHGVVALYAAVRGEIDPSLLHINDAVWPRVEGEHIRFCEGPLQPGKFDIPEPTGRERRPDVVLVPGVAFDRRGHRLGYGRGYYDRALAASPGARRIGLCHSFQLVEALPEESHDEPVDYIVTPDGVRATNARPKETP